MLSHLANLHGNDQPPGGGHGAVGGQVQAAQLQEHHWPAGRQVQHEQAQDLATELEPKPSPQGS